VPNAFSKTKLLFCRAVVKCRRQVELNSTRASRHPNPNSALESGYKGTKMTPCSSQKRAERKVNGNQNGTFAHERAPNKGKCIQNI